MSRLVLHRGVYPAHPIALAAFWQLCMRMLLCLHLVVQVQEKLDNGESNEWLMYYHWLAIAIFGVTSVINAMHGWGEVKELLAQGPQDYFSSTQNWLDIAQFLNVLLLGPLVVTGSPVARVTGSIGTVLMLPKMAMVARGHERMSALVMVLLEVRKAPDLPFCLSPPHWCLVCCSHRFRKTSSLFWD
jgi:hypothetical protein